MKKRSLAMLVVAAMALPAQALAEVCFTDGSGGEWSFEIGQQQGAKIPVHGFRQIGNGCVESVNGVEPFTGELVVVDSETGALGLHVNATDDGDGCASFRANFVVDLTTGSVDGEFWNDYGNNGSLNLDFTLSCPDQGSNPNSLGITAGGPDKASN